MSSTRNALMMGAAIVLGCAAGASAADLHGGSIKDAAYFPAPAPSPSLYFRLDGGRATYDKPSIVEDGLYDFTETSIGSSWTVGGGIGMYFSRNLRGDITYDHGFDASVSGHLANAAAPLPGYRDFKLTRDVVLANLYYDFDMGGRFTPYIGAGLGWARLKTSNGVVTPDSPCGCWGSTDSGSNGHVAAALMTGLTWKIRGGGQQVVGGGSTKDGPVYVDSGRGLYLDAGYRFLYLGKVATGPDRDDAGNVVGRDPLVQDIHAHEFRVGLRYDFR